MVSNTASKRPRRSPRYIARKGSICVDGVSLTVNRVKGRELRSQPDPAHPQGHHARAGCRRAMLSTSKWTWSRATWRAFSTRAAHRGEPTRGNAFHAGCFRRCAFRSHACGRPDHCRSALCAAPWIGDSGCGARARSNCRVRRCCRQTRSHYAPDGSVIPHPVLSPDAVAADPALSPDAVSADPALSPDACRSGAHRRMQCARSVRSRPTPCRADAGALA